MKTRVITATTAGILFATQSLMATTLFTAHLTNDQEVPAQPNEGSSATATLVLSNDQKSLTIDMQLFGLDLDGLQTPGDANDNVTRLHIHRAIVGSNGAIVYGMIDGAAALRNDNNPNNLVVNPVAGTIHSVWNDLEGNGTTLALELANLFSKGLYLNIHTTDHAGGEIRGQIIPEPATFSLLLGASLLTLRRRRSA